MKPLTKRRVRRARRIIARERCDVTGIRHRYRFDGYFWHHCRDCGRVS